MRKTMFRFSWVSVTLIGFAVLSLTGCKTTTGWGPGPGMFSFWSPKTPKQTARTPYPPPSQSFSPTPTNNVASSTGQSSHGPSAGQSSAGQSWGNSPYGQSADYRTADNRPYGNSSPYDSGAASTYGPSQGAGAGAGNYSGEGNYSGAGAYGGAGNYSGAGAYGGAGNYGGANAGSYNQAGAAAGGAGAGSSQYSGRTPYSGGSQYQGSAGGATADSNYESEDSSSTYGGYTPPSNSQYSGNYSEHDHSHAAPANDQPGTTWSPSGSGAPYQPGSTGRSTNQSFESTGNVQPAGWSSGGRTLSNY